VIPPALIAQHELAQSSIETLAGRALTDVWRSLDLSDARAATDMLLPRVREITVAYGELSAVEAADFYDEARASSRPRGGRFRATAASPAETSQVDAMTRWAVTPVWAETPRAQAALSRLAGGTQRLVRQPARETIHRAVTRDPADARYVRKPQPGACDFCLMLASRAYGDTTYTSAAAAETVVGREVRERSRMRDGVFVRGRIVGRRGPRGRRHVGDAFHDRCGCEAVPVWSDDDVPEINQQLAAEWDEHASTASNPREAWREHVQATYGEHRH
jgi:hypothetical protein